MAKVAKEIVAADAGWSMMPPPDLATSDVGRAGLSPKPVIATDKTNQQAPATATQAAAISPPAATPFASVPPDALFEDAPPDPDLWVVSYGEEDDRELTEKQIAAALAHGTINLSTIVWQEGMDEWLPISGVKRLAKYAPVQKATSRQARGVLGNKNLAQATRAEATAAAAKSGASGLGERHITGASNVARSDPKAPAAEIPIHAPQPAAETTAGKGPPPITRSNETSGAAPSGVKTAGGVTMPGSKIPVSKAPSTPASLGGEAQSGAKPPPIVRHSSGRSRSGEGASPWDLHDDFVEEVEEVVTSAPYVGATPNEPPIAGTKGLKGTPPASPRVSPAAQAATLDAANTGPSQRPTAKASMRPPKPVETATSLVMRTEGASGKDFITDEDFMAMQRRFPKWALPVAVVGGVAVVGLIVWGATSGEEPPPLPVVPVVASSPGSRENPANQAQPRHPQPNLDTMPTGAAVASEEKDFAKLFAQSASKTSGTFDAKAAERAVQSVMEVAARCRVAPEPSGQARVVLTFATAGQVLSVQVGSPYAGTATGKCVEKALRGIKTRPFQGEPGRLPVTVPIH